MSNVMDDTDDEITLQEALEEAEIAEQHSMAVLGASDPDNCSYSKGYMKRQALYACLTCNPKGAPFAQPAGVCLACSYQCHEGHDMVELFTKRNFRCDCGNKKFSDNPCRLQPEKDELNEENNYNQNYDGLYCSCHRPYPDPDTESDVANDPMIQCIVCEDWYHFQHSLGYLNSDFEGIKEEQEDFELICGPCMQQLDFLGHYSKLSVKPKPAVEVELSTCEDNASAKEVIDGAKKDPKMQSEDSSSQDSGISETSSSSADVVGCPLLKQPKEALPFTDVQGVAWKGTLRTSLCQCAGCMALYDKLKIKYLLDPEDTIEHYESLGIKTVEERREKAEASLNNQFEQLGHVGKIEFAHGFNLLKEKLAEFLKTHNDTGKTVRREDVENFFAGMKEEYGNKRRRLE